MYANLSELALDTHCETLPLDSHWHRHKEQQSTQTRGHNPYR